MRQTFTITKWKETPNTVVYLPTDDLTSPNNLLTSIYLLKVGLGKPYPENLQLTVETADVTESEPESNVVVY